MTAELKPDLNTEPIPVRTSLLLLMGRRRFRPAHWLRTAQQDIPWV